ncbi:MAG: UDP-N-acetylglucosamine 1-carboxyvinyltransferase [Deltaproteobacteria bacterium]|jgi:UDP-N-acetylglucosamine 1-carboxyvinyltransferase|nr:UDP-N-acetylglucosamine 1-carboxyvinyltransferase [Deltaproteobacteria bacterium]
MEKLIIHGGKRLRGRIRVSGSKNAALPILLSAILVDGPVRYLNVPRLRDINTANRLLDILGCPAAFEAPASDASEYDPGGHTVRAEVQELKPEAPYDLVKTMRASVLVLGPLLARLGLAKVALPGGCAIGARPVELHLKALERMGAEFKLDSGYIIGRCKKLHGADISFDFPTVGGTENLLMAASLADGETILRNAAREPEVSDLAHFLNACGARISGIGSDTLYIEGVDKLSGCSYLIMPDRIEAGTFMAAAAITGGELELESCPSESLSKVIDKMEDMGARFKIAESDTDHSFVDGRPHSVTVSMDGPLKSSDISTAPYPGFPTDMQAQFMAMMSLARGSGTVEENIFENRFMHVPELNRMGADIRLSGSRAVVHGVKKLTGAPVMASDLRASASLVLAGLAAKGETHVQRIYHLDRGYERIENKLRAVGAEIVRARDDS